VGRTRILPITASGCRRQDGKDPVGKVRFDVLLTSAKLAIGVSNGAWSRSSWHGFSRMRRGVGASKIRSRASAGEPTCGGSDGGRDPLTIVRPREDGRPSVTTIYAEELQPGDVLEYGGHAHYVTHVDRRNGWAWPVAFDDHGWAMALGHSLVVVHRAA
jgi:hypothetical protein